VKKDQAEVKRHIAKKDQAEVKKDCAFVGAKAAEAAGAEKKVIEKTIEKTIEIPRIQIEEKTINVPKVQQTIGDGRARPAVAVAADDSCISPAAAKCKDEAERVAARRARGKRAYKQLGQNVASLHNY